MKTIKYYKLDKKSKVPQIEGTDVYFYGTDGNNNDIIGVSAEDHTQFEAEATTTVQTFSNVSNYIESSHLNKELNKLIVKRIREEYSVDDEIALLKKKDTDPKKIAYQKYVDGIKAEVDLKKIEYGIKQPSV